MIGSGTLEQTVARAQAGDVHEFGGLVRRYQNFAFGYALSIVGNFHDAEDAVQDAFVEAYRCLAGLREVSAFPSWLRKIVHAQCHRRLRKRQAGEIPLETANSVASSAAGPAEQYLLQEDERLLLDAVNALPRSLREVISLYYLDQHSISEIAAFLDAPNSVVKNRLFRARQSLKRRLIPMETTFKERALSDDFAERIGRIISVHGPVLEAQFTAADVPPVLSGLKLSGDAVENVVVQVVQQLGNGRVRAVVYPPNARIEAGQELSTMPARGAQAIDGDSLRATIAEIGKRDEGAGLRVVETGIKVIDLFCPLVVGGSAGFFGDPGAGKAAVIQEIVARLEPRNESVTLFAFVEHIDEAKLLLNMKDPIPAPAGSADTAYIPVADATVSANSGEYDTLDTAICFSAALAQANRWPAIDPLTSRSVYLESGAANERHRGLAAGARELLRSTRAADGERRKRLQAILMQPLQVGEPHSGTPGVYVPLHETLRAVEELIA